MSKNIQSKSNLQEPAITLTFESALAELEIIVNQMESGQFSLEQSLEEYKRGSTLLQFCQKSLADIEQQICILNEANQLQSYSINDD